MFSTIAFFCATSINAKTNLLKKTKSKILTGKALNECLENTFNRRMNLTAISEIDGSAIAIFHNKAKKTDVQVKIGDIIPNCSAKVVAINTDKNTVTIEEKKQKFTVNLRAYKNNIPTRNLKKFDLVKLNFEQTDIRSVLLFLSELTGENIIADKSVRGNVTVISPSRITQKEAANIIYSVLAMQGFTIVRSGKTAMVIRAGNASTYPIEISTKPLKESEVNDLFRKQIIFLKYIPADRIRETIVPLLTRGAGQIIVDNYNNSVIIIDTARNIKQFMEIIKLIDQPKNEKKNDDKPDEKKLYSFKLNNEKAGDLIGILNSLYPGSMNMAVSKESDLLFINTTKYYHNLILQIINKMDDPKNEK